MWEHVHEPISSSPFYCRWYRCCHLELNGLERSGSECDDQSAAREFGQHAAPSVLQPVELHRPLGFFDSAIVHQFYGEHVEFRNPAIRPPYDGWGVILANRTNRGGQIGRFGEDTKGAADLCPSCIDDLFRWWGDGKAKKDAS